ncbi:MAG: bifunctional adenosylcobinamide kinase/adenosylcobinamide-phosphate guanylyltransferase [Anaerovoracaceae bacterium]
MNVFVSGGCKNGKSMFAQELAREMAQAKGVPLYYLATMIPKDDEDQERVIRHCQEREGWGFETIEQGKDICQCLKDCDSNGVFLFDSVTALLENEMFKSDGSINLEAGKKVQEEVTMFAQKTGNTIFVSDFIYCDAMEFYDLTENYKKSLAGIDKCLGQICQRVVEVSYGSIIDYKEAE